MHFKPSIAPNENYSNLAHGDISPKNDIGAKWCQPYCLRNFVWLKCISVSPIVPSRNSPNLDHFTKAKNLPQKDG